MDMILLALIAAPVALCGVMVFLYGWFAWDWRRRYPGVGPTLLGALLLVITTAAACNPDGPGLGFFGLGLVVSVCLGWRGYKAQRKRPWQSSAETLFDTLATPVPSARAIRCEDVLGRWQFYVDAAASTVTIELGADGRYRQVIVTNRGQRVQCPGGSWTLLGPYLELTSYRNAVRGGSMPVRWFFGDRQNDLILFAKDDPQAETRLQARRVHDAESARKAE